MAKIVITVEDDLAGGVKIVGNPGFGEIAKMINSGSTTTPAHGYAMAMYNRAREVSKDQDKKLKILIPRLGRK